MPYKDKEKGAACVRRWRLNNPERRKLIADRANKKYAAANPNRHRDYARKIRLEAFEHYGSRCACCGEDHYEFLGIDHINGGGTKHRKEIGNKRIEIWLRENNWPPGFRTLCHNCNLARGFYGYCPHERE